MVYRTGRGWFFAALLAMLSACALLASALERPTSAQSDPTPTLFYTTNDDPGLNAEMDHVEQATSILRALEPSRDVTRAFLPREDLLGYLNDLLDRIYPLQRARDDAIFYHAFGWMDLDTDLRAVQLAVLTEQIAGFYDTDIDVMFVISSDAELDTLNQITFAHEFTHALQDQYYDLDALGLGNENSIGAPDELLAAQALVEGDAMLLTEGFETWLLRTNPAAAVDLLGEALFLNMEALLSAPPILYEELLFPYTVGRNFAYTLFIAGNGWRMVNEAYADPPRSTEQIIHPELYVAGSAPVAVSVGPMEDRLGPDWRLVYDRTLGEFYLREHLRTDVPQATADSAAAGWGGDRYRIYFNDATQETVLVLRIVWDTPTDAAEFAAAYRGYGALRFDDPGVPTDSTTTCWYAAETLCLWAGANESLIALVPDRALIADVLASQPPVR